MFYQVKKSINNELIIYQCESFNEAMTEMVKSITDNDELDWSELSFHLSRDKVCYLARYERYMNTFIFDARALEALGIHNNNGYLN